MRFASLVRFDAVVLGAAATAASGCGSTDSRRDARGDANGQVQVGSCAVLPFGAGAVVIQAGVDVLKTARVSVGPFAVGGLGAVF